MMAFTTDDRPKIWTLFVLLLGISSALGTDAWAQDAAHLKLPDDPETQKAKDAYNQGKYADAVRHFRTIARTHSRNVPVYRELARSLSWADEPEHAIRAYWQYLALAPDAPDRDKVNAELGLLLRRVKKTPSKTLSKNIRTAFEEIKTRTQDGRFNGQEGALGALNIILNSKHISPRIADAEDTIRTGLQEHSTKAIDRWWRLEERTKKSTLAELVATWEILADKVPLKENERRLMVTLDGLTHLAMKEYPKAAKLLSTVAPGHPRLRYAQALAFVSAKKYDQASAILKTLARGDADPRIHILLGFAQQKSKKSMSVEHFILALTSEAEDEDAP